MSDNIKSRIQLKNDTEENWDKAINFIPKRGELIIYNAESGDNVDDDARRFPRFKVGDGVTTVVNLPFATSKTINGVPLEDLVAKKVSHKLTFGAGQAFVYDGSEDVTVPVYTGTLF